MAPRPVQELKQLIEQTQGGIPDARERDRALAALERDTRDLLGTIQTYRSDTQLAIKGESAGGAGTADAEPA